MMMHFLDQRMVEDLIRATKKIQDSSDLEAHDMPVLNELIADLHSTAAGKEKALANQSQGQQASSDRQESNSFLTVKEAAAIMQVSKGYLYKLVAKGKIPATKMGKRQFRIRKSDILNFSWDDVPRESSQQVPSRISIVRQNFSVKHKSPESYEDRVRGPRQRQTVN
jgi:excisionase family DNA binding protein